jgi:hypothetical protein
MPKFRVEDIQVRYLKAINEMETDQISGWLQRTKEVLRTPDYIKYTEK